MKKLCGAVVFVLALAAPSLALGQGLASPNVLSRLRLTAPSGTILANNNVAGGGLVQIVTAPTSAALYLHSGQKILGFSNDLYYDAVSHGFRVTNGSAQWLTIATGAVTLGSGVKLFLDNANASACSACASGTRGRLCFIAGGAGVKDIVTVCAKDVGDAYAERVIY